MEREASVPMTGEKCTLEAVKNFKGGLNLAPTVDKTKSLFYMSTRDEKNVAKDLWILNSGLQGSDSSKLLAMTHRATLEECLQGEASEHQLGKDVKTIYYCR